MYTYIYIYTYTYILDTSIHHLFYHQFLHVIEDLQVAKSPGVNLFQQGFTSDTCPKRSWFLHHEKRGGPTVSNKSCGYSKSWLVSWKIPKNKWMIFGKNGEWMWMVSIILNTKLTGSWWSYLLFWRILDLQTTWFSTHESVTLVTPGLASKLLMVGFLKPYCW